MSRPLRIGLAMGIRAANSNQPCFSKIRLTPNAVARSLNALSLREMPGPRHLRANSLTVVGREEDRRVENSMCRRFLEGCKQRDQSRGMSDLASARCGRFITWRFRRAGPVHIPKSARLGGCSTAIVISGCVWLLGKRVKLMDQRCLLK